MVIGFQKRAANIYQAQLLKEPLLFKAFSDCRIRLEASTFNAKTVEL